MRRGIGVNLEARCFHDCTQKGLRGTFAIGAADVNDRRQIVFGVAKPLQYAVHAVQTEINDLGMQRQQPCENGVTDGHGFYAGTNAVDVVLAGCLIRMRAIRATVAFISRRETTISTIP